MRLDSKVHVLGALVKNKDGTPIPEDEFVVFRPADNAFLPALTRYCEVLGELGASPEQQAAADQLVERVKKWRQDHPERCKVPDVQAGELQESSPPRDENEDLVFYIRSVWTALVSAPWPKDDLIALGKLVYAKIAISAVDEKLFGRLLPNLRTVAVTFKRLVDERGSASPASPAPATEPNRD